MKDLHDCAFCRMMRALAFSGLGAAVGGYGALYLFGASRENALMAAMAGGVILVMGMNLRERRRR